MVSPWRSQRGDLTQQARTDTEWKVTQYIYSSTVPKEQFDVLVLVIYSLTEHFVSEIKIFADKCV